MEERILRNMCRGRGLVIDRIDPPEGLLLPPSGSREELARYRELLDHYAARLILKEIIKSGPAEEWARNRRSVERFCEPGALDSFLGAFARLGVTTVSTDGRPTAWTPVRSFGPTYEWYVSRVISSDLGCPSAWGVRFADMPAGGDHDVIASVSGRFLYLEAKTAPPKHIEQPEASGFVRRLFDIAPDIAVFHNDTHLRMKDKIVPMLEEGIESFQNPSRVQRPTSHGKDNPASKFQGETSNRGKVRFQRLEREIFHLGSCIYVVNSKPDLKRNLGVVLRHHFRSINRVLGVLKD